MRNLVFLSMAVILAVILNGCSGPVSAADKDAAPGQGAQKRVTDAQVFGFGPKVTMTYALMGDRTFADIFAPTTKATDIFNTWVSNCTIENRHLKNMSPICGPFLEAYQQQLKAVVDKVNADPKMADVIFRNLYIKPEEGMKPYLDEFRKLTYAMDIPWVHLQKKTQKDVSTALDQFLGVNELASLTFEEFYLQPLSEAVQESTQDIIGALLDGDKGLRVLRHDAADVLVFSEELMMTLLVTPNNMCCDRLTRKCVVRTGYYCTMAVGGLVCATGCNYCP